MSDLPDYVTPTTELEAVNVMLSAISEAPVTTLDDPTVTDAAMATTILRSVSRSVQKRGWHFNTDKKYILSPENDGTIPLPINVMRIDPDGVDADKDYSERNRKLWNRTDHTFVFEDDVSCEIVWLFPFDELPESARDYIAIRATRIFQDRLMGSDTLHRFNEKDELQAKMDLEEAEGDTEDLNILTGSALVLYTVQR